MELILHYFPDLSAQQREQFAALGPLYNEWNARVNLISRNDIVHLYERHVLHSLGVAMALEGATQDRSALKGLSLRAQSRSDLKFIDVGTGGGFPGVPLAILYPQCTFHMIDGIGKKIAAVQGVIEGLGLTNATAEQVRSEDHRKKYDVIVSRAVTTLPEFLKATKHLVQPGAGRMLYLKGGELADEILPVKQPVRVHELASVFKEEFFATKKVVEVQL